MWLRKYGWLNFAIFECSLNVWIVNKTYLQRQNCVKSALRNPKFLLKCLKWRHIKPFLVEISNINIFHITKYFWVKSYKRNQWNLSNILPYISGIFDDFFEGGLIPLKGLSHPAPLSRAAGSLYRDVTEAPDSLPAEGLLVASHEQRNSMWRHCGPSPPLHRTHCHFPH